MGAVQENLMPLSSHQIEELEIPIPVDFRGFTRHCELEVYRRNLPHWRCEGATYFVTFRQADSIPHGTWEVLSDEARRWRLALHRFIEKGLEPPASLKVEYSKFLQRYGASLDGELDACHGSCRLRSRANRKVLADSLEHFVEDRYRLHAAVIMPNHCHAVVRPFPGYRLEEILQGWKGFSSLAINRSNGENGSLWQAESYDRIIRDERHYQKAVRYILKNPMKARLEEDAFWIRLGDEEWGSR